MIKYNSQKEKDKQNKICREKIAASIISEAERRKAYEEKRLHLTDNQDRLKKYIAELRSTYTGDILLFLENNVISKWARLNYRRDASLAHHDVENALRGFNNL